VQKTNEKKLSCIENESIVPVEIDTHLQIYGKHMWDVKYDEKCPLCDKKIDEFGFCACNSCIG
jgi:hypothetical protein